MANRIKLLILSIALCFSISAINAQTATDTIVKVKTTGGFTAYNLAQLKTFFNSGVTSGTVTSANASLGGFTSSGAITSSGTIGLTYSGSTGIAKVNAAGGFTTATAGSDYLAPFGSQTANQIFAAPAGSNGVPVFRTIVASDIPILNQNTSGSAGTVTTNTIIANGQTLTLGAANNATAFTLQNVTAAGSSTTTASTFSGGLTSSGTSNLSLTGFVDTLIVTNSNLSLTKSNATINNGATAITLTIPAGLATGTIYFVKVADGSTGTITVSSSENVYKATTTTATIIGGSGQTYQFNKNIMGYWSMN